MRSVLAVTWLFLSVSLVSASTAGTAKSITGLRKQAEAGDAAAQHDLGLAYAEGAGVR